MRDMQSRKISHDEEGDILYLNFSGEPADGSLAIVKDMILLRFNKEKKQAVGLTFLAFSCLLPSPDDGKAPCFRLERLADLPEPVRRIVWDLITHPPVSHYLHVTPGATWSDSLISLIPQPALTGLLGDMVATPQPELLSSSQRQAAHP